MTKSESPLASGSISSEPTDDFARADALLALGHKLVEELELQSSNDTLGRWMAHYIAELMIKAESACEEEKTILERTCFDAILNYWKYRSDLLESRRPFKQLEPIARAIESLDPDDDTPRYFRSIRRQRTNGEEVANVDRWFELANEIDYSAKLLIKHCLGNAARAAMDKSKEWVKLAEAAGAETDLESLVIRFVSMDDSLDNKPDPNADVRYKLENRLKRLEWFNELATAFSDDLRSEIKKISTESDVKIDGLSGPNEIVGPARVESSGIEPDEGDII